MLYSQSKKNRQLDSKYRYRVTTLVYLGTFLSQLGVDLYTPSMPMMRFAFHTTSSNIQLSLTTYLLGYALPQLMFGYLADKIGRRPTLLIGYLGFFIATLLILSTHNIVYFLLFRFLQGASGAAFSVIMRTTFRDLFSGIELTKVAGYFTALWALIPILAPALGGYVQHYFGWHAQFEVLLGLCVFFLILTWQLVPETKPKSAETEAMHFLSILRKQITNYELIMFAFSAALVNLILFAYVTLAPFLLQISFSLSPITFGWLVFSITIFNMLGSFITGKFADKLGNRKLITSMLTLMLFVLLCMLMLNLINPHNLYFILIPVAIMFFADGVLYPAIAGKAYATIKQNAGVAVAIYGTIAMLTTTAGVGIVALLPHTTILPFVYLALGVCVLILLLLFSLRHKL